MATKRYVEFIFKHNADELNDELKKSGKNTEEIQKKLNDLGKGMENVGKKLTKNVTLPILGIGTAAIASANEFDKAKVTLIRGTGETGKALDGMLDSVKRIYKQVPQSIDEVSRTMSNLNTLTGATGSELEKLTQMTMDYARVNNTEASVSAGVLGRLLNGLGKPISELPRYMDKMTTAALMSGIGVNELSEYIIGAGPAFEELGYDVDKSIALFSSFYKAGAEPREVVSSLNRVMISLSNQGMANAEESFQDLLARVKDAPELLDGVLIAAENFGGRVGGNIADDIRAGRFEVDDWVEALNDSEGMVEKLAKESMSFSEEMRIMKNIIISATAPLGQKLIPVLKNLMDKVIMPLINWFSNLDSSTLGWIVTIGGLLAALGPIITIAGKVIGIISTLMGVFQKLKAVFMIVKGILAVNPFTPIILGIAALLAVIWIFRDEIWQVIEPIWELIKEFVADIWENTLQPLIENIKGFVLDFIEMGAAIINDVFKPIVDFLMKILAPIFNTVFGAIAGFISTSVGIIGDVINNVIGIFRGLMQFITGVFTLNWKKAWSGLVGVFRNIVGGLANIFKAPLNFIIGGINGFIRGLNKIKIPSWVPGVGGKGITISQIPMLAEGGIVDSATAAIIGEGADPEAVVPLNPAGVSKFLGGLDIFPQTTNMLPKTEINITIPQTEVAMVDMNYNKIGTVMMPRIVRTLKSGGAN